jgi:hypothetical protein
MPKRKKSDNPDQLSLFSNDLFSESQKQSSKPDMCEQNSANEKRNNNISQSEFSTEDNLEYDQSIISNLQNNDKETLDLFLPFTYEDILEEIREISDKKSRLPDLIVPVTKFEGQIIQVLANMRNSGFLLFLYGVSGVGKSTFVSSLKFQTYIPIKEVVSIKANELEQEDNNISKFDELINQIKAKVSSFFLENTKSGDKLCIVIEHF